MGSRERSVPPTLLAAISTWAAQKRALYLSVEQPIQSVLGRIKVERVAAGEGDPRVRQRWDEVYRGDGLLVQMAVSTLPEVPRLTVTFYYVLRWPWRVPVPHQAREIGISRSAFWANLHVAEQAIDTGLQMAQRAPRLAA
jgi:hypothetical protein